MSNSIFDWPASLKRFVRFTTAKAEDVNDALDGLSAGLDTVEANIARSVKLPIGTADQTVPLAAGQRAGLALGFDAAGNVAVFAVGGRWRGDWAVATQYAAGDFFRDPSSKNIYATELAHTSSGVAADLSAGSIRLAVDVAEIESNRALAQAAASAAALDASTASSKSAEAIGARDIAVYAADAAVAAYDSFDDRYLGPKASDPATDNDGNPLAEGALYWNTSSKGMRIWDGSSWLSAYVPSSGYVTLSGAQTLQEKTLISPVVTKAVSVISADQTAQPSVVYALTASLKLLAFASPQPGQWFGFRNFSGVSTCSIGYSDKPIEGDASDFILDDANAQGCCMYVSAGIGWRVFKF